MAVSRVDHPHPGLIHDGVIRWQLCTQASGEALFGVDASHDGPDAYVPIPGHLLASDLVSPIPGAHFTGPPCAIPSAADDAIVPAEAGDIARFGRIDRRIREVTSRLDADCPIVPPRHVNA